MEEDKEINEGNRVTMFKVWYMDVWKCHNKIYYFVQLIYAKKYIQNINVLKLVNIQLIKSIIISNSRK
jgi:hypothetical protein